MSALSFSEQPGAYERHLRRKSGNSLFPENVVDSELLENARVRDLEDVEQFNHELESTVSECLNLKSQADSGVVLSLKEKLDLLYERCCGLAGERKEQKMAIKSLVAPIMLAIEKGAATDPVALQKLQDEKIARQHHFFLLENQLVCDLLRPDSPILADDLAATLLSESPDSLMIVLDMFDETQLQQIIQQGKALLDKFPSDSFSSARNNMQIIEQYVDQTVH